MGTARTHCLPNDTQSPDSDHQQNRVRSDPSETRPEPAHRNRATLGGGGRRPASLAAAHLPRTATSPPSRRAAEQRDELAPSHSKISSARPDKGRGTVMPSVLAVFRFRNSSTLVDC